MKWSLKAELLHYCYAGERTIEEIVAELKKRNTSADDDNLVELVLDCVRAGQLRKVDILPVAAYKITEKGKDELERERATRPYPIRF
jgi:DNA-binding PadR family transcriptional regulator